MLSSSEEIAARGAMLLYVNDLAAERRRLDGLGIALGDDNTGECDRADEPRSSIRGALAE